jgi:hypothetical protein
MTHTLPAPGPRPPAPGPRPPAPGPRPPATNRRFGEFTLAPARLLKRSVQPT